MTGPTTHHAGVTRLACGTLVFNLAIILWGALVRATGSGAGCGNHWPLCNGEVAPGMGAVNHAIEFTHRISVAVGIVLVGWLWARIRRSYPPGSPIRTASNFTVVFTVSESLIGAGLVLFKLVAHDASVYRAVADSAHLINTFLLVASLTLTVWWANGGHAPVRLSEQGAVLWILGAVLLCAMIVGVTGAITALGETLFPAASRDEIGRQVSANAHFLKQLRVYHPMAAVTIGALSVVVAWLVTALRPVVPTRAAAYWVTLIVALQVAVGFVNLFLLAPLAMQLLHLLLADALWIALILMSASALAADAPRAVRFGAEGLTAERT